GLSRRRGSALVAPAGKSARERSVRGLSRQLRRMLAEDRAALPPGPQEPARAAALARLRYVSDGDPGLRREKGGGGFRYRRPDGKPVRDPVTLARIRHLAIPPAWTEVWICPRADGHIQ